MKKVYVQKLLLLALGLFFSIPTIFSQTDAHYWTHQFGSRGLLMNGAVIASTEDETAIFYNPGAMIGDDDINLSLSFLTPSYSLLKTKNYLGNGNDIKDKHFGFAPGLGSLGFNPFGSKKIRMAFSSFTRFKSNISFRGRVVNEIENSPNELFIGNIEFSKNLKERWVGLGACIRLTNFLSIGATQFVTFHSENSTLTIQKELVERNNPTNLNLGWRNRFKYSFSTKGAMLTKFGVLLKAGKIKIGTTLTTPSYSSILNSSSYEYDDLKIYGQDSTALVSNFNKAKFKDYRTPLSVGFGMDFPIGRNHLSFSIEYFKAISPYTILEDTDDPFDGLASGGIDNSIIVKTGNQRVINFAVGCETKLSEKLSLIWGFRTDFNQANNVGGLETLQFLATTPNVYHVSIGNSFEIWNSKFSFGLDYGFGRKKDDTQLVDFSNIDATNFFDFTGNGKVISNFQTLNIILAYDFKFKKKK